MIKIFVKYLVFVVLFCYCMNGCKNISQNKAVDLYNIPQNATLVNNAEYIIVLGDIQEYTNSSVCETYLHRTMGWISAQKQYGGQINCVLQVGDITNGNLRSQWDRFYNSTISTAEEILYVTCTGNHDYDWDSNYKINDRESTHINEYAKFPLTQENIVEYFETDKIENIVVANTIHNERYDILVLEFGPRTEVVEWANKYVSVNSDRKFILMTHEFLTREGERINTDSYAERQFRNTTWSSPEIVWQKLIDNNDNIVCVLCGHNGFSKQLYTKNRVGREVPQILFNLQYQENGGDGWVQLWEFPERSDSVTVKVYNTISYKNHPDSLTFKFRYRY